jgi:hypothetical protein
MVAVGRCDGVAIAEEPVSPVYRPDHWGAGEPMGDGVPRDGGTDLTAFDVIRAHGEQAGRHRGAPV